MSDHLPRPTNGGVRSVRLADLRRGHIAWLPEIVESVIACDDIGDYVKSDVRWSGPVAVTYVTGLRDGYEVGVKGGRAVRVNGLAVSYGAWVKREVTE